MYSSRSSRNKDPSDATIRAISMASRAARSREFEELWEYKTTFNLEELFGLRPPT
ncbi:hypothetical protein ALC56_07139 [Trachymyrmex septentrionalis]|uniref:Uncharacterized protein n=1 Tax=Trachymyrmex septentrionalis TaxID=34720 RepID=A0A151JWI8_9HYME|nr:hypothetical protein ALC56_07139 [Trachymyrmex septentrionalis]